jgi:hypothetical protein
MPLGIPVAMPTDADATYVARMLPKLPKQVFPKEMPSWKENVLAGTWTLELMQNEIAEAIKEANRKYKSFKNDLGYMNPIPYEGMANEAANRYISKNKR